jgi:4-hydroxysphinganine ceramide fatty acyl 2-hydroxylase
MEKKETGRIFKSKFLESLTRTHIAVPLAIFYGAALVLVAYSLYYGTIAPLSNLWLFVGGFLLFTLVEYLVHRYAFHIEPDTPQKEKLQYTIHGVHHDFPRDKSRLAMPPVVSILLATGFLFLYKWTLGNYGLPFTAGFLAPFMRSGRQRISLRYYGRITPFITTKIRTGRSVYHRPCGMSSSEPCPKSRVR